MKQVLFTLGLLLSITSLSLGQRATDYWFSINFDDQYNLEHLFIDTVSNPNNIWKIGAPNKTIFTTASSLANALVTDLNNPYPTNDTSTFIITIVAEGQGFEWPHTVTLAGKYYVNSDTLTDYGKIEFSPDNGVSWVDLLNDTVFFDTTGYRFWNWDEYNDKPVLTGNSNEWKYFHVDIAELGHYYGLHDGDTIMY